MADEIQIQKITDLDEKTSMLDADLFPAGDNVEGALKKTRWSTMLSAIKTALEGWTFSGLTTTSKTIIGALKELKNGLNTADTSITSVTKRVTTAESRITTLNTNVGGKEPTQKRAYSGCYYKDGYDCFLHAANVPATDVVKTLDAAYRPKKAVVVSGWCLNNNTEGFYPCVGLLKTDGTWNYLSALNELGQKTPYYIYNPNQSADVRGRFNVWLNGAWATNTNGT